MLLVPLVALARVLRPLPSAAAYPVALVFGAVTVGGLNLVAWLLLFSSQAIPSLTALGGVPSVVAGALLAPTLVAASRCKGSSPKGTEPSAAPSMKVITSSPCEE